MSLSIIEYHILKYTKSYKNDDSWIIYESVELDLNEVIQKLIMVIQYRYIVFWLGF